MDIEHLPPSCSSPLENLPELVWKTLIQYLEVPALLSLRRTCQSTRIMISSQAVRDSWTGYSLTIKRSPDFNTNEADPHDGIYMTDSWSDGVMLSIDDDHEFQTFENAVQCGISVTEFKIYNPGPNGTKVYDSPGLSSFLTTYGPHIRKLKVETFGTLLTQSEFTFFASLTNLLELEIDVLDASQRPSHIGVNHALLPRLFPPSFKNLKSLRIRHIYDEPIKTANYFNSTYHWELIAFCSNLDVLGYPYIGEMDYDLDSGGMFVDGDLTLPDEGPYMEYVLAEVRPVIARLNVLDWSNTSIPLQTCAGMREYKLLMETCLLDFLDTNSHFTLQNMSLNHLWANVWKYPRNRLRGRLSLITSLTSFPPVDTGLWFPNLEHLRINSTFYAHWDQPWPYPLPDWPKLNLISLVVDRLHPGLQKVLDFLFKNVKRPSVRKLRIHCEREVCDLPQWLRGINCKFLAGNFYNLRELSMDSWNIQAVYFLHLWGGLLQLEELTVRDCATFGDAALIGNEPGNPAFHKLKNLRVLSLTLDKMPLITDVAFQDVFSKMGLKELYLNSIGELDKITLAGISSLLDGTFGETIERFPFANWSLASVAPEEFAALGKKFRSIC